MDNTYLHSLVAYLHIHPHIGLAITFVVAFAESLPVLGAVIPGSVTMTAIGVLIGSGVMPLIATMFWAILGALCGDFLSFWIGTHYQQQIKQIWPFRKNPNWLLKGEAFFHKHGGKSVVFGRFFGPVRSAVPLIAGLMQMSTQRFILAAAPSAMLWALIYMCPGIFVGALSLELPSGMATKFILGILIIVAFGWLFFLLLHLFFKKIAITIDRFSLRCWRAMTGSNKMRWVPNLLSYPQLSHPHRQLILLLSILVIGLLFCWVFLDVAFKIGLFHLNEPLFLLFRSLRIKSGEIFMLLGTMLGDKLILLPATMIIFAWLLWKRYLWTALHWLGLILLSAGAAETLKHLYYSARPPGLLHGSVSSSFPSGHSVLGVCFYGFLAVLLAQNMPREKRKIPYLIAGFISLWILVSRLYLGAHWFTDVLAGLLLALMLVLLATLSYRSRSHKNLPYKRFSIIASGVVLVIYAGYTWPHFPTLQNDYTLYWSKVTLDKQSWWENKSTDIPLFVDSRLGKPREVLNVQWLGNRNDIEQLLIKQGWQSYPAHNSIQGTWHRLSARNNAQHLPLLPALYQNHSPILLLTKSDENQQQLILMLWESNVTFTDTSQTLWLGSLSYYIPRPHTNQTAAATPNKPQMTLLYEKALNELTRNLKNWPFKIIAIPLIQQPPMMNALNWDGKVLLIQSTP